jgi:hypothetical protein
MAAESKEAEAPKQELPVNHPQAGYVSPDLSLNDGNQILPDEEPPEEEKPLTREERIEAREAEVKAVAEHEDKVAKAEAEEAEAGAAPEQQKTAATKEPASKS